MSAQHTPGPWRVDPTANCDVQTHDGELEIACAHPGVLSGGPSDASAAQANARLIAAAPDLLGVVRDLFENPQFQVAIGGNPNMVDDLMARAQAAIAKATVTRVSETRAEVECGL